MNRPLLTEAAYEFQKIREVLYKFKEHDRIDYGKILDVNKKYDLTEDEWKIKEIISKFENKVDALQRKHQVISDKVNRKNIKIYLFGKVSVGKSKILNAILGENLFASGITHTTSSFVHVNKSPDSNFKIKTNEGEESFADKTKFIEEVERLSGDIARNKNHTNETIEVSLCIDNNKILREGIEIVDCPGSGNKNEITDCIKKNSEDADMFIFVMNHALTDDDKVFFKYQSEFSTKPDVFILINSWDESDNDDADATNMCKDQINKECYTFLKNLGITNDNEISERIYFISALEMFEIRVGNDESSIDSSESAKERYKEFKRFEYNLSKYIDNPQENKTRRYKKEIEQIINELSNACKKFPIDILKQKNDSLVPKYEKLISELKNLKNTVKTNCGDTQSNLIRKIDTLQGQILSRPEMISSEWITSQLEQFNIELNSSLQGAWTKQYKEVINFLKCQDGLEDKNSLFKRSNPTIKKMWNPSLVKPTSENQDDGNIILSILEELTIFPIPNPQIKMMLSGISLIARLCTKGWKSTETDKLKQAIIQQLNYKKEEICTNIDDNINLLNSHYMDKINEIINLFQQKNFLFREYWRKIQLICKELDEID